MKNFTNNFKQFTSRLSARWLIMALMLLVGTSSVWGAVVYYVDTNNWGSVYIHYWGGSGGSNWHGNQTMEQTNTKVLGFNVYSYDKFGDNNSFIFKKSNGDSNDGKTGDITGYTEAKPYYYDGGWYASISEIESEFGIDYLEILKGDKIAFYIGEPTGWNNSKFYLRKSNSTKATTKLSFIKDGNVLGVVSAKSESDLYITHSESWSGNKINTEPVAGGAYICGNGTAGNNATNKHTTALAYSFELTETTIKTGETCSITEGTKPKTYQGNSTSIRYFVTTDNTNFTEISFQNGALQTGSLAVGTYTIRPLITDGIIYAIGTDQTLTVETACDKPDAPSITINPGSICSVDYATITAGTVDGAISYSLYKGNNDAPAQTNNTGIFEVSEAASYRVTVTTTCGESRKSSFVTLSKKTGPTASNYVIKDASKSKEFTGSEQTLTAEDITVNNNAGAVASIYFKQDGNTVDPINVGVYEVYVTTDATEDICAGDIKIGTFTINEANQINDFAITNDQTKYCGLPSEAITLTATGGSTNETVKYVSSDEIVATISGSELTVLKEGSVTITATRPGGKNYNDITATKQFTFYKAPEKPTASQVDNIKLCKGEPENGKIVIKNVEPGNELDKYEYTINNGATGNAKDGFVISNAGDYVVTVTRTVNGCTMQTNSDPITVGTDYNTPTITDVTISGDTEVCINTGTTLTCNVTAENYDEIAYLWSNGATAQSIQTGDLAEDKTFTVTVTARKGECEVTESKSFEISIIPLSEPAVSVIASSGVESVNLTINLTTDGCGKNFIYGYRYKLSDEDDTAFIEKEIESTSSNAVSTIIENLITGKEYIIQAYVVNVGFNNNQKYYTEEVTCTVMAAEDCTADSDVDYIEILCRNESTGGRDMNCYAYTSSGTPLLGAWPGSKTDEGDHKYNGTDYAYWKLDATEASIVFNYGTDEKKTGDIEGLEKGKRYVFTINSSNNYTKKVDGENIYEPEVETVSITPIRNQSGTVNVTMIGKVIKRGCSDIVWYGFQSKTDNGNWTDIKVAESNLEAGSTYSSTKSYSNNHTYSYRAKLINANGTKVYGEPISFYAPETDVNIAEVGNDTDVNTTIYYDFVGLYVNSILKPSDVKVESYTWKLNGNTYIDATSITDLYGNTNLITTNGSNNIRPNKTGNYTCEVLLENGVTLTSNTITITSGNTKGTTSPIITRENRTLPVISVKTNKVFPVCEGNAYPSAQASKLKKKRSVDVKIFDAEGRLYYDRKARMNYRGSSSLNFVKKSYAFCPGDADCGDNKDGADYVKTVSHNMFDLGASDKDWVLYAAAADPSMMRNRISFETYFNMTNKWGVKTMYVELIVDGEYKGVYVFMDKITNNIDRVNITAADGFIVKFDKTDVEDRYEGKTEDQKTFATSRTGRTDISTYGTTVDQLFEIEYPEKDVLGSTWNSTVTQIQNKFEEFETALAEGRYETVRTIIDYESWADWFIFNEYSKNQDAYRASCIFVYNGDKIEARPLWDQELSFNNQCRTSNGSSSTTGLLINNDGLYTDCFPAPFWFTGRNAQFGSCGGNNGESTEGTKYENYLLKDACFISMIKQRWAYHTAEGGALSKAKISNLFTTFSAELEKSQEGKESEINSSAVERENSYWNGKTRATAECGGNTGYSNTEYSVEKTNLIEWIEGNREKSLVSREENLATEIGKLKGETMAGISLTLNPANGITTPWMPLTVTVNVEEGVEYNYDDTSITEGISDAEKARITKSGNKYKYLFPRPTDWGEGNVDTALEQKVYPITVGLKVIDTQCPGINNEASAYIKLTDEGNDICE